MKIKHTHITVIAGVMILSGCTTYPKNYTYSPTVNMGSGGSNVILSSPFAKKPQPVPECRHTAQYDRPPTGYDPRGMSSYPVYPVFPSYRCDLRPVNYEIY